MQKIFLYYYKKLCEGLHVGDLVYSLLCPKVSLVGEWLLHAALQSYQCQPIRSLSALLVITSLSSSKASWLITKIFLYV